MRTSLFFGIALVAFAVFTLSSTSLEAANYTKVRAKVTFVPHDYNFLWSVNKIDITPGDNIRVVLNGTATGTNVPNEEFIHFAARSAAYQEKVLYDAMSSISQLKISSSNISARIERPWFYSPNLTEGKFEIVGQVITNLTAGQEYKITLKGAKGRESHGFLSVSLDSSSGVITVDIKIYDKELNDVL